MTRGGELIEAMREVSRILTAEIDRPGENEDRFRALKQAEKVALAALEKASAPLNQEGREIWPH